MDVDIQHTRTPPFELVIVTDQPNNRLNQATNECIYTDWIDGGPAGRTAVITKQYYCFYVSQIHLHPFSLEFTNVCEIDEDFFSSSTFLFSVVVVVASFSHRLCASRQIRRLSLKETRRKGNNEKRHTHTHRHRYAKEQRNHIYNIAENTFEHIRCVRVHANMYDNRSSIINHQSSIIDLFSASLTMTAAVAMKYTLINAKPHTTARDVGRVRGVVWSCVHFLIASKHETTNN